MITKEQLLEISRIKKLNKGQAEKDYLIDVILYIITSNTKDELVFKGGTCLNRAYNLDRFSEDLDFTQTKKIGQQKLSDTITRNLKYFNMEAEATQKRVYDSILTKFKIKGPLYTGDSKTQTTVRMDVNTKSTVILEPQTIRVSSLYPDVPSINVLVMQKKEILAEKIRALLTRTKARDIYDINYLLENRTPLDKTLVEDKLAYYNEKIDLRKITETLEGMQNQWEIEIKKMTRNPPKYGKVAKFVLNKIKDELS